jgi:hypothetical protein
VQLVSKETRISLRFSTLLRKLKFLKQDLKKYIGRKLAARVLNTWHEDFVDEDTGEVVSIERNEIILDRDTIIDKDNVEEIIDSNVKSILLHKKMLIKLIILSFIIRYKRSNKSEKKLLSIFTDNA